MTGFKKYLIQQRGMASETISTYTSYVESFLEWLESENIKPQQVRHQDVMSYLRHLDNGTKSHSYVQQMMVAVRHYYDYLVMAGKLRSNPATGIIKRGTRTKVFRDALTEEQLHNIYDKYSENTTMGIRNKVTTGLLIYQGLHTYELGRLVVGDIDLNKGTVHVRAGKRNNTRTLKLEPCQMTLMKGYIKKFRPAALTLNRIKTDRLIFPVGGSESIGNVLGKMKKAIRKIEPRIANMGQIRASVIANWMRKYDPIRVMTMAGHRYVSSTEYYALQDIESLRDELDKLHPLENVCNGKI